MQIVTVATWAAREQKVFEREDEKMFTEDFDLDENTPDDSAEAQHSASSRMFDETLSSQVSGPTDRTKHRNDAPPDVSSPITILDSAGRARGALDDLADKAPGLSRIEKNALKELQQAVLSGEYSKIATLVRDFKENPKAFSNIAAALKKNLEANGVTVSYEVFEPKQDGKYFPPYGTLTFGLKSNGSEATLKLNTTDSGTGSELNKSLARALQQMVVEQYDLRRANQIPPDFIQPSIPPRRK